jgi:hypothetical protein
MGVSLSSHKGTAAKTRSRLRRQLRGRKKIFDRAGNKYHGRIASLADGAREAGLSF